MRIPLYRSKLLCIIAPSIAEGYAKIPKPVRAKIELPEGDLSKWQGTVLTNERGVFVVILVKTDSDTIAHEAHHATMHVARYHGLLVDADWDEHIAYLQGWINSAIVTTVEKHRRSLPKA